MHLLSLIYLISALSNLCCADWWKPSAETTMHIQYAGNTYNYNLPGVDAYNIDGDAVSTATVSLIHSYGKKVICYYSAGSYENYRSDASSFPSSVLGKVMDGWPDEKWLDIRQIAILQPIMEARVQRYSQKGCDGVDPDNVDGYNNDSGFDLSPSDQLAYNRMIATIAHNRNMSCGLKNDLDQIPDLVASFDYSVNEQCHEFNECDTLDPFIKANKPVFNIEYKKQSDFCPSSIASGYSSQMKNLALDQPAFDCRICNRISTRNNISCTASLAPPSEPASTAYAQTTPTSTMGTQNSNTKTSSTMGTQTSDTKSSLSPSSSSESDTTNDEESFAPILAWCFATTSAVIYLSL